MECPNCGSYMKYQKNSENQSSWYCPKCKTYSTPETNIVTKANTKKSVSPEIIAKYVVILILLFFNIGFLINFQKYERSNKIFTILFILFSIVVFFKCFRLVSRSNTTKDFIGAKDNTNIAKIKLENKKLKSLMSPELQNASNMINATMKLKKKHR